jgi:hypothetical protein
MHPILIGCGMDGAACVKQDKIAKMKDPAARYQDRYNITKMQ